MDTPAIDNIFVNTGDNHYGVNSVITYSDISDHFTIAVHIETKLPKQKLLKPRVCQKRLYNIHCVEQFNTDLCKPKKWINHFQH